MGKKLVAEFTKNPVAGIEGGNVHVGRCQALLWQGRLGE